MLKRKYRQYTKRIITLLFLIQLSIILNKEKSELEYLEVKDEVEVDNVSKFIEVGVKESPTEKSFYSTSKDDILEAMLNEGKRGETDEARVNLGLFDSQECLYDKSQSKDILNKYKIDSSQLDENMRFALGPCNPVLFIPGLYSTRLVLSIDCKKFSENRKDLVDLRLFCGASICNNDYEEHVIWPALFDSPFQLHKTNDNKYSACLGYFFNYHTANECPKVKAQKSQPEFLKEEKTESICLHNDAVKITFYGGTKKTEKESQCGVKAVRNIVSIGGKSFIKESWFNSGSSQAFQNMYDRYYEMGYRTGFSMAGVPYDFRKFVFTNDLFKNIFKQQIERLYANTGKPVVIIAHSFGCINTLNQLLSKEGKDFSKKIKKFVAVAPPFAGAPKSVELFLHGSKEFDTKISIRDYDIFDVELDSFGQKLTLPFSPFGYELRPNPILYELFNNKKYKNFKLAIEERLKLEKDCYLFDCEPDYVEKHSKNFQNVFKNFPGLNDTECGVRDLMESNSYKKIMKEYSKKVDIYTPTLLPCRSDVFNTVSCPTVRFRKDDDEDASSIETKHCYLKEDTAPGNKTDLFIHSCLKKENCLDKFYDNYYAYPYVDKKMVDLIERFMVIYGKDFPDISINITNYFDTKEMLKKKIEKMLEYHVSIWKTKDLEIPDVDTMIIYGSYLPTKTAYVFDEVKNSEMFRKTDVLAKGGDGTVPSWSSLLIGLKWLYDKESDKLPQKVQLVEYCSLLSQGKSKFKFDPKNKDAEFMAISCDCLNSDFYDFKKTSASTCDHGRMITDSKVVKFLENYLIDENNTKYDTETLPEARQQALINYSKLEDYESLCNADLREIAERDI